MQTCFQGKETRLFLIKKTPCFIVGVEAFDMLKVIVPLHVALVWVILALTFADLSALNCLSTPNPRCAPQIIEALAAHPQGLSPEGIVAAVYPVMAL